jgi:hypothetical protein
MSKRQCFTKTFSHNQDPILTSPGLAQRGREFSR